MAPPSFLSPKVIQGTVPDTVIRPIPHGRRWFSAIAGARVGTSVLQAALALGFPFALAPTSVAAPAKSPSPSSLVFAPFPVPSQVKTALQQYCLECHDADSNKGNLDLQPLLTSDLNPHSDTWERVVRKLQARQMPPIGKERPTEAGFQQLITALASPLDQLATRTPNPGRTETFRRLNRVEYQNAVRDLLGLDIDATAWLPKDDASHGFDNVAVGGLSPTLLNRYLAAADKISRLAVGSALNKPGGDTFRLRPDRTQEEPVEGLPPGTRGGMLLPYSFPSDGEYEIQIRLTRDRNEEVEGLREAHELEVLLDRSPVSRLTVAPPKDDRNFEKVDAHLKVRLTVTAGRHDLGITFLKQPSSLVETRRQPYQARYNMHRHPRLNPAIYQISITGPFGATGAGETPSRRRIFSPRPAPSASRAEEDRCAEQILSRLLRQAWRRPVTRDDLAKPMEFYSDGRAKGDFEAGIEAALGSILVSPEFLFRVEHDPAGVASGAVYRLDDVALASRLSFFLWSSLPDEELLKVAERGELHQPRVLEKQVRRLLADPRAESLVGNFASQWLHLRNLESFTPDLRLFPDFDDNLREAFRRETELHFEELLHQDLSVLRLLQTDHTFLNERLARHYGIPHVHGSQFRRVALAPESHRGGLLRQGSILTVTSYATRTSPVLRGNWILGNLLGTPPPPPPPNVPNLKENTVSESLPMRQRLAEHRARPACAGCHNLMDPVGFSLENFDATGRWRTLEDGQPIDASGGLPDGSRFSGVSGLEENLLKHPDLFAGTLTEKLLTFALGRGLEPSDAPAVRRIVRESRAKEFRFSSIVLGIVNSPQFTHRKAP